MAVDAEIQINTEDGIPIRTTKSGRSTWELHQTSFLLGSAGFGVFDRTAGRYVAAFNEDGSVDFFCGLRLDLNATANETRVRIDENGSWRRVKIGASGTGPGGVGRALYID